nr:EOG090X04G9 [Macrothrix elegans]
MPQEEKAREYSNKKNQTNKDKDKKSRSREKFPTKVIVRKLPPTMVEELFLEQISPIPDHDYFSYVIGEKCTGVPTFSSAYINFLNHDDIFTFQEKFDGYIFVDRKGIEYQAIVEFATFQKIPRLLESEKEDKCNSIDSDSHYTEFLKKLHGPGEIALPNAEMLLEQIELKEKESKGVAHLKVVTPLVEFIQQRRVDREKYREEKKEERRKKELDRKKHKELERLKKKDLKKEERMNEHNQQKLKADEFKTPNVVKVLKNIDRESQNSKCDKSEIGNLKKQKEVSQFKQDKLNEKGNRDRRKSKGISERVVIHDNPNIRYSGKKKEMEQLVSQAQFDKDETPPSEQGREEEHIGISDDGGTKTKIIERKPIEPVQEKGKKIRNKDRPALQIYRPGAKRLAAQKPASAEDESVPPISGTKLEVKTRTFSRSTSKD